MNESSEKFIFSGFVISIATGIQIYAWNCGHNGQVFAFTSLVIGAVAGAALGISLKK